MVLRPERPSNRDFQTLGVKHGASPAVVKNAFRLLVKRWHPDRFQQQPYSERLRAEEKFKEITAAFRRITRSWDSEDHRANPAATDSEERNDNSRSHGTSRSDESSRKSTGHGNRPASRFYESYSGPAGNHAVCRQLCRHWRVISLLASILILLAVPGLLSNPPWLLWNEKGTTDSSGRLANIPQGELPSEGVLDQETIESHIVKPDAAAPDVILPRSSPPPPSIPEVSTLPSGEFFTIGSIQKEVLQVQGAPTEMRGQTWIYGLSEIIFKDGSVTRYNNFDGALKVRILPAKAPEGEPPEFFTLASSVDEVLLVQGTPTRLDGDRFYYGFSEVRFRNGRVEGFENFFGNLKVRMFPSDGLGNVRNHDSFTIGSDVDDVLATQGTPSSIRGNIWFYQMSSIVFRGRKVQHVTNAGGNLRFVPVNETSKRN